MPIPTALASQALAASGFEESPGMLAAGSAFRLPVRASWWIITWVAARDAIERLDVELDYGPQQVGSIHRFTSPATLAADLPGVVARLKALAASDELRCPRCRKGWATVRQPKPGDRWEPFLSCTRRACWRDGDQRPLSTAFQPVVVH